VGGPGELAGEDRLQKILAHAGVGSRRACEELILQGRVTVGGQVVRELGTKVNPLKTTVALDGQKIHLEKPVYFAVFKPKGYVSTNNDPSGRPRVLDLLPEIPQRVYTVGRLDEMSIGLMLLTNDGELANKLAHPKYGVEKLYRVIVAGLPTREVLDKLTEGVWLAEGKVRAKRVRAVARKGEATILEMVLAEGKNREVRRMLAKLGHKVMSLTRVAVGPITTKGLSAGQYRPLTGREVDLLRRVAAGEPVPMPWSAHDRKSRPLPDRPARGPGRTSPPTTESGPPRRPVAEGRAERPHGPGRPAGRPGPGSGLSAGSRPRREGRDEQRPGGDRRPPRPGARDESRQTSDRRPPRPGARDESRQTSDRRPPRPDSRDESRQTTDRRPPRPGGPPGIPNLPPPPSQRGRASGDQNSGPRPGGRPPRPGNNASGRPAEPPVRRSRPPAGDEPRPRRMIGFEAESQPAPAPERDDRPRPRMKRPPSPRRPVSSPRPLPRRRKGSDETPES
jgi:23S rRNA pseudouridine2605 synthase